MYGYYGREDRPRGDVVTTYEGVDIHFNKHGEKFEALLGRKVVRRATIQALRKEIGRRTEHKATLMHNNGVQVVVVGKTTDGKWRREDGEVLRSYMSLYEWDADLSRQFEQLRQAERDFGEAVQKRHDELRARLVRVDELPPMPEPEPEPKPSESVPVTEGRAIMARRRQR